MGIEFDFLCPVCNEMGFESPTIGMCDPCECDMHIRRRDEKVAKELVKYEKKTGKAFTEDSFYNACMAGEIDKATLKGFPELRSDYEWCEGILWEQEHMQDEPIDIQGDLFTTSDLPF